MRQDYNIVFFHIIRINILFSFSFFFFYFFFFLLLFFISLGPAYSIIIESTTIVDSLRCLDKTMSPSTRFRQPSVVLPISLLQPACTASNTFKVEELSAIWATLPRLRSLVIVSLFAELCQCGAETRSAGILHWRKTANQSL